MRNKTAYNKPSTEEILTAPQGQKVSTYGPITVRAVTNSYVEAQAGATVIAEACSFIEARHGSRIIAKDGAVIFSYGGAIIERSPNARVLIIDKKTLTEEPLQLSIARFDKQYDSHKLIVVSEDVYVKTGDNCYVLAFRGAIVETGNNCRIVTFDSCVVKSGDNCFINTGKRSRVYRGHNCRVSTGADSKVTMDRAAKLQTRNFDETMSARCDNF